MTEQDKPRERCPICNQWWDDTEWGVWISIKDRLPEEDGIYLTYGLCHDEKTYSVVTSDWYNGNWYFDHSDLHYSEDEKDKYITHWMPLPKPPEDT
jgi:hypothetical protein